MPVFGRLRRPSFGSAEQSAIAAVAPADATRAASQLQAVARAAAALLALLLRGPLAAGGMAALAEERPEPLLRSLLGHLSQGAGGPARAAPERERWEPSASRRRRHDLWTKDGGPLRRVAAMSQLPVRERGAQR
mmetsp:Transcript_35039/g.99690  ORF Transcript_35039/g.99690 Transcript_35039/m.99690 type:complete len:134 (-) Transcript_35039:188-589(-)